MSMRTVWKVETQGKKKNFVRKFKNCYLGCVCFGFKSLLEMLFRKCGCLVARGK